MSTNTDPPAEESPSDPTDLLIDMREEELLGYLQQKMGPAPYTAAEQEAVDIQFLVGQVVLNGSALTIQIDYPEGAPQWVVTATTDETHDGGQTVDEYEGVGPSLRAALQALYSEATGMGQPLQLEPIPPPMHTTHSYEPDPRD